MAIYGYARVSTTDQAEGTSLEDQRRRIEGAGLVLNQAIDNTYEDAGVSGSTPLQERPAGGQLFGQLEAGDTVVVAKLDRLFRNAQDALAKAEHWKEAGVNLVILDMGLDPVTDSGISKLMFTMLAAMAEWERERIRERMAEGKAAKAAKGGYNGGPVPFGHYVVGEGREARLVPLPSAAEARDFIENSELSSRKIAQHVKDNYGISVSHVKVTQMRRAQAS